MPLTVEREFVYTFSSKDQESVLRVPVTIPYTLDACDLTGRLVYEHNLPCYIESGKNKIPATYAHILNAAKFICVMHKSYLSVFFANFIKRL